MKEKNKSFLVLCIVGLVSAISCASPNSSKKIPKSVSSNTTEVSLDSITLDPKTVFKQDISNIEESIVQNRDSLHKINKPVKEEVKKHISNDNKIHQLKKNKPGEIISHEKWHNLLKSHVNEQGDVDYEEFLNDKSKVKEYTNYLKLNWPKDNWPKNDQLAYWINLYNASTIELILDHYPVKSIRDIPKPWDNKFIEVNGKKHSLNDIENVIIRPTFKEPRIHFAVNCAAISCPKLLNEAFHPAILEKQLNAQTSYFVNNASKNKLSTDKVEISKIFEWYKDDFKSYPTIIDFLNKYSKTKISPNAKIEFLEYNWNLNNYTP